MLFCIYRIWCDFFFFVQVMRDSAVNSDNIFWNTFIVYLSPLRPRTETMQHTRGATMIIINYIRFYIHIRLIIINIIHILRMNIKKKKHVQSIKILKNVNFFLFSSQLLRRSGAGIILYVFSWKLKNCVNLVLYSLSHTQILFYILFIWKFTHLFYCLQPFNDLQYSAICT